MKKLIFLLSLAAHSAIATTAKALTWALGGAGLLPGMLALRCLPEALRAIKTLLAASPCCP